MSMMNTQYTKANIKYRYEHSQSKGMKYLMIVYDQASDQYSFLHNSSLVSVKESIREYRSQGPRYVIKDVIKLDIPLEDQINKIPCYNLY